MKSERRFRWILLLTCLAVGACSLGTQEATIPVTTSSDRARKLFLKGRNRLDVGLAAAARSYFRRAMVKDAEFALARLGLAQSATTEAERLAALRIAMTLANRVSVGERRLILAFKAGVSGDMTGRMEYYRELVRLYPDDARVRMLLGRSYEELGGWSEAVTWYKAAIELDPGLASGYFRLGNVYQSTGRHRQAEGAFVKYVELSPLEPDAHRVYAELIMKTGRFEESIENYEKALALDSDFSAARIGIANNLIFLERPEDARRAFQELYESADEDRERLSAQFWIAALHLHAEDPAGALTELRKALADSRETDDAAAEAEVLRLMGDILLEAGDADSALTRYKESFDVVENANFPDGTKDAARGDHVYHEARVAIAKGQLSSAGAKLEQYREALGGHRGGGVKNRFNEMRGRLALAGGDHQAAVQLLERADREDPRILYLLAQAYHELGREQEALKNCRRAADFNAPEIEFAFVRAKARRLLEEI